MANHLLAQLELKIDEMIENFSLIKNQVEELEERNADLQHQNQELKHQETEWEHSLHSLLHKLEDIGVEANAPVEEVV